MKPDNLDPFAVPNYYKEKLNSFERFCLLKTMHPEMLEVFIEQFIKERLGEEFLSKVLEDDFEQLLISSSVDRPVLLCLNSGLDPYAFLQSKTHKKTLILENILVGRQQAEPILRVLEECAKNGNWILLQTFTVTTTVWAQIMQKLDNIKSSNMDMSKWFKLFISCSDFEHIPFSVLRNSLHLVVETPSNFKTALNNILEDDLLNNQEFHDSCDKKKLLQQIAMPLCFIHSVLQERIRIGVGGFSNAFNFISADFKISLQQLQILLSKLGDDFSLNIIKSFLIECNYGARMTNKHDIQLLQAIVDTYLSAEVLQSGKLPLNPDSEDPFFTLQDLNRRSKAVEFAQSFPANDSLQAIGIDAHRSKESKLHFDFYVKKYLPKIFAVVSEKMSVQNEFLNAKIMRICRNLPNLIDVSILTKKFPLINNYLHILFAFEVEKLNNLLTRIRTDLDCCLSSLSRSQELSEENQTFAVQLNANLTPKNWKFWTFSSVFSLFDFLAALNNVQFYFQQLISTAKTPDVYAVSVFSSPKALIQALKMNYAKEKGFALDSLHELCTLLPLNESKASASNCFNMGEFHLIYGQYDFQTNNLQRDNNLQFSQMVQIKLEFVYGAHLKPPLSFDCPVYAKRMVLNSDACMVSHHEYLFDVCVPTELSSEFLIKAGTKLFVFKP